MSVLNKVIHNNFVHIASSSISESYCFDGLRISNIKDFIMNLNDADIQSISELHNEIKKFLINSMSNIDKNEHINKLNAIIKIFNNEEITKECEEYITLLNNNNEQQFINNIITGKSIEKFINKYIILLSNAQDWLKALKDTSKWFADFNRSISVMLVNNISSYIASQPINNKNIHNVFSEYINNTEFIEDKVINILMEYYQKSHFDINFVNKVLVSPRGPFFVSLVLNQSEITMLIKELLKYIQTEDMSLIDEQELEKKVNAHYAANLDKLKLEVNESIELDGNLLHALLHSDVYVPIIYINGNIVRGTKIVSDEGRTHHYELYLDYLSDMSLHKDDIIKKTEEEWLEELDKAKTDTALMYKNWKDLMRIVADDKNNIVVFSGYSEAGKEKLKEVLDEIKIYVVSDNATLLTRLARKKRIQKYIYAMKKQHNQLNKVLIRIQ